MEETAVPTPAIDDTTTTLPVTTNAATTYRTTKAKKPPQCVPSKKQKHSAFDHLIKAALFILRGKGKKSKSFTASSTFAKLFFSVRPLHLQDNTLQSPPPPPPPPALEEVPFIPLHEVGSSSSLSSAASSSGGMSRYASAQNLQDLDNEEEDEEIENDAYFDGIEGDEMIDAKAEEFIAHFYQEMRLQH
ncbi:hypothetical protein Dimus_032450 [Dionaea muscipula]